MKWIGHNLIDYRGWNRHILVAETAEWMTKEFPKSKPGGCGCVSTREFWSTEDSEEVHRSLGHHWLCEFGDVGNGTSCEKEFNVEVQSTTSQVGVLQG